LNVKARILRAATVRAAGAALLALALLSGCIEAERDVAEEGERFKANVEAAFERNATLASYVFAGSLSVPPAAATASEDAPPAAALLPAIAEGVAWHGAFHREPLALQGDVSFGAGAADDATVPLLLRDGSLFFHIPGVNRPDEFFEVPSANADDSPLASWLSSAGAFMEGTRTLFAAADPVWVKAADEDGNPVTWDEESGNAASTDGPIRYRIDVTEQNAEAMSAAFLERWNDWRTELPDGVVGSPTWTADTFRLAEGGFVEVVVNADGFATEQRLHLSVASDAEGGRIDYALSLSALNAAPSPSAEAPKETLPFEQVLKFLAASAAGK